MTTPHAHELLDHETFGDIARAKNACDADFLLLQSEAYRMGFLEALVRDAERLANAARALLEETAPKSVDAPHVCANCEGTDHASCWNNGSIL